MQDNTKTQNSNSSEKKIFYKWYFWVGAYFGLLTILVALMSIAMGFPINLLDILESYSALLFLFPSGILVLTPSTLGIYNNLFVYLSAILFYAYFIFTIIMIHIKKEKAIIFLIILVILMLLNFVGCSMAAVGLEAT